MKQLRMALVLGLAITGGTYLFFSRNTTTDNVWSVGPSVEVSREDVSLAPEVCNLIDYAPSGTVGDREYKGIPLVITEKEPGDMCGVYGPPENKTNLYPLGVLMDAIVYTGISFVVVKTAGRKMRGRAS